MWPNLIDFFAEEKKVRNYLDNRFSNRPELVTPDPKIAESEHELTDDEEKRSASIGRNKNRGSKSRDGRPRLDLILVKDFPN